MRAGRSVFRILSPGDPTAPRSARPRRSSRSHGNGSPRWTPLERSPEGWPPGRRRRHRPARRNPQVGDLIAQTRLEVEKPRRKDQRASASRRQIADAKLPERGDHVRMQQIACCVAWSDQDVQHRPVPIDRRQGHSRCRTVDVLGEPPAVNRPFQQPRWLVQFAQDPRTLRSRQRAAVDAFVASPRHVGPGSAKAATLQHRRTERRNAKDAPSVEVTSNATAAGEEIVADVLSARSTRQLHRQARRPEQDLDRRARSRQRRCGGRTQPSAAEEPAGERRCGSHGRSTGPQLTNIVRHPSSTSGDRRFCRTTIRRC